MATKKYSELYKLFIAWVFFLVFLPYLMLMGVTLFGTLLVPIAYHYGTEVQLNLAYTYLAVNLLLVYLQGTQDIFSKVLCYFKDVWK